MMSMWRANISELMDFLEADDADTDKSSIASLIYFVGEVESDGVMGYLDRHDKQDIEALKHAARLIDSEELNDILCGIQTVICSLPQASSIADQITMYLNQIEEDPFEYLEGCLGAQIHGIELQIQKVVSGYDY